MGGIQAINSWSIAPQHHSISLCSSLPSILWLSSRGTNCYAFAPGERLIQPGWDLSSHEASCHSTTYNISFFLTLSNWCACPLAQEARGYGAQKNGVGMEVTVHWQQVVFLMRSHKLCASAASDKHTSDATGRSTKKKKKNERWIFSSSLPISKLNEGRTLSRVKHGNPQAVCPASVL